MVVANTLKQCLHFKVRLFLAILLHFVHILHDSMGLHVLNMLRAYRAGLRFSCDCLGIFWVVLNQILNQNLIQIKCWTCLI